MIYSPDRWLVLRLSSEEHGTHYRVFATWRGGYVTGDSWKLNSGIVRVQLNGDYLEFTGGSGSVYRCHRQYYGNTFYGESVLDSLIKNAESKLDVVILPAETNFLELAY